MEETMRKSAWRNTPCLLVIVLLVLVSLSAPAQNTPTTKRVKEVGVKEAPLTNNDVVKMVKFNLGDEVVTAKIKEAKTVAFNTDVGSLEKLKKAGVSPAVITAMLKRNTAPASSSPQAQTSQEKLADKEPGLFGPSDVVLCSRGGNYKLNSIGGSISSTYAFVTVLIFADFPGRHASTRVKDSRPSVLIDSKKSPAGRYFLVKAESNKRDGTRSVKMGRMHMFSFKSINAPDKDWVVKTTLKEEKPGIWRLSPVSNLKPGEYGLLEIGLPQIQMYDFGVDK